MKNVELNKTVILRIFFAGMLIIIMAGFIIGGVIVVKSGLDRTFSTNSFISTALKTNGTVVKNRVKRSSIGHSVSDRETLFYPVIEFTPQGTDKVITFISKMGASYPTFKKGEKVAVLYQVDNHNSARIDSFYSLWGDSLISLAAALFIIAIVTAIPIFVHKKMRGFFFDTVDQA